MKKVKKITIILTILLVCLVSFVGIYVPKQTIMRNIVKDYKLGMNLAGYREVRLKVAEKEEITNDKVERVKNLIEKRLEQLSVQDYLIKTNHPTGEIVLELEETTNTDQIVSDIYAAGKLEFVDSKETTKVLMTNEHLKQTTLRYGTTEEGTTVYLDFEFTEEGKKILKDLTSNQYKTIEQEETEEKKEGEKEEDKQARLTLQIDGTALVTSSFKDPIADGRLQLSLNEATMDTLEIQNAVEYGATIATILNNGPFPIKYELNNHTYIYSEITETIKIAFTSAIAILILVVLIVLIIKYKMSALLAAISYVGFVAVYLLVLRYANVTISLEGIAGILVTLIINLLLTQKVLAKKSMIETFKEMGIQLVPVIAVIIAFSFIGWTNISSFGMTMFWGLLLTVIYHVIATKALLEK